MLRVRERAYKVLRHTMIGRLQRLLKRASLAVRNLCFDSRLQRLSMLLTGIYTDDLTTEPLSYVFIQLVLSPLAPWLALPGGDRDDSGQGAGGDPLTGLSFPPPPIHIDLLFFPVPLTIHTQALQQPLQMH